jgi:hypothetical protein
LTADPAPFVPEARAIKRMLCSQSHVAQNCLDRRVTITPGKW